MNQDEFLSWALDPARTLDERFTLEVLAEEGVHRWNRQRKIVLGNSFMDTVARHRERKLNPAYEPFFTKVTMEQTAESLADLEEWAPHPGVPLRSLEPLRFFPSLRRLQLIDCEAADLSPLEALPLLEKLVIGSPGYLFMKPVCRDFTPIGRCRALRELKLGFSAHWPLMQGLETLPHLETLILGGNLLALPPGITFPHVRRATLFCLPLAMRSVAQMPQVPACELLEISGIESLAGIEHWPKLRNLKVRGPFESFEPLTALPELTCLTITTDHTHQIEGQPLDLAPVARIPKLHFFQTGPEVGVYSDIPRDFAPLAEAPALRELIVKHCPPVQTEVAAIQAGFPPSDDLFLLAEPRPLPPLRMIVAAVPPFPLHSAPQAIPGETGLIDEGMRACEGRWVGRYLERQISDVLQASDWGEADADGLLHTLRVEIHSYAVVERFALILDTVRTVIATLRHEYQATLMILLRIPPPPLTPERKQLEDQFQEERDRWEFEQNHRDNEQYLENLHRLNLKKEEGAEIDPAEFSPKEPVEYPEADTFLPKPESEDDEEELDFTNNNDEDDDDGDIAVDTEPPPIAGLGLDDHAHPLADAYRMMARVTLDKLWVLPHQQGIAQHLLDRDADEVIPNEPPPND